MTVAEALASAIRTLEASSETPVLEAEWLLAHVLKQAPSWLLAYPEHDMDDAQSRHYRQLLQRRANGEPYAYLTGQQGFWLFDLAVNPDVLIPRPETELLVELALERIAPDASSRVADLGTGSGAIAIALALERPRVHIVASDASAGALAVAFNNASRLGAANIRFAHGDWHAALPPDERYAVIVSNPPYIAEGDAHLQALAFEPRRALVAANDGLAALQQVIAGSPPFLETDGWLFVEHGADQGPAVRILFNQAGYRQVETWCDLAGLERVTGALAP